MGGSTAGAALWNLESLARVPDDRPNIVLIIADDMAWDDCGAYGHRRIRTPNIDKLAAGGMRFTNAFLTASSCSPSRASIITGRYPHCTDAEQLHWPLPAEQQTFVELLRNTGYWTASAGKWHFGNEVRNRFDVVHEADVSGFQLPSGAGGSQPAMVAAEKSGCERWLSTLQARPKDRPFFLWLAALDPHRDYEQGIIPDPHRSEDVVVPPYLPDVPEVRKDLALYYDEIARLDSYVGRIMDELGEQRVEENTFVLFFSDNGRPFPRDKTTLYDGGIKTPWIVRWPRGVRGGSLCGQLVSSVDIAPTVLAIAGLSAPSCFQGRDFSPLLKEPEQKIRDYVFAEDHWHDYEDLGRAVRSLRYKYIRNDYRDLPATPPADVGRSITFAAMRRLLAQGKLNQNQMACFVKPRPAEEFYDTINDPHELHNLVDDPRCTETLDEHRRALDDWSRRTDFRIPKIRTPDEFDRETGKPLPNRIRPRPSKKDFQKMLSGGSS
ncbi:MAG: heparan N-sulfatase [Phycisphaerae bacterium SG8_4]|nr:MAG: heparan N-sulfatase [Phycisphaerae bacterium SG8_4]